MSKNSVSIHIVAGSVADARVMAAAWPAFLHGIAQLFAAPPEPAAAPAAAAAAVTQLGHIDGCRLLARALPQRAISLIAARAGLRRRDLRALMRALVRAAVKQQHHAHDHDGDDDVDHHHQGVGTTTGGTDDGGDEAALVDPAAVVDETDLLPAEDAEADAAAQTAAAGGGSGPVGGEFYPTFVLRSGGRDGEDTVDPLRAADVLWFAAMCLPSHFAVAAQDVEVLRTTADAELPSALQPNPAAAAASSTSLPSTMDSPSQRQNRVARLARILKPVLFAPTPQAEVLLLKGGTTNQLYKVRHTQTGFTVVLRVFGEGSGAFIDRDSEFVWQSRFLHTYGRCWNGMVYEFLDRHAPLPAPNVRAVALEIADAVALFHAGSMRVEQTTSSPVSAKVAAAAAAALSSPTNLIAPVTTPEVASMATPVPVALNAAPGGDGGAGALQQQQQQQVAAKPQIHAQDPLAERRDLLAVVMLTKWIDMAENVFSAVHQKWKEQQLQSGAVSQDDLDRCPATDDEAKKLAQIPDNGAAVAQLVNHMRKHLLSESRAVLSMISRMASRSPIVAACHNDLNTINIMTALAQMADKAEAEEAASGAGGAASVAVVSETGSSSSSPVKDRPPTSALATPVADDVAALVAPATENAAIGVTPSAISVNAASSLGAMTSPSPAIILFGAAAPLAAASAPVVFNSPQETFPTAPAVSASNTTSSATPITISNVTPTPASSLAPFGVAAAKSTTHLPDPRSFVAGLSACEQQPPTPLVPTGASVNSAVSPGSLAPGPATVAGAAEASARRLVASAVSESSMVRFIDFEYAGPNFALYDVANHWNEWGGLDCNWCFVPTPAEKRKWMARYLSTLCHVTAFTLEHLATTREPTSHGNSHEVQQRQRHHRHHARSYSRQSHEGSEAVAAKLEAALDFNEQQRERSRSVGRGAGTALASPARALAPTVMPPTVAAVASPSVTPTSIADTSKPVDYTALCNKFYDVSTPLFQFCSDVLLHLPPAAVTAEGGGEIDDETSAAVGASLALAAEARVPLEPASSASAGEVAATPTTAGASSSSSVEPHVLVLLDARRVDEAVAFTDVYTLVSHVGWAAWAVIQAGQSVVDFDFIGYGVNRWRQYLVTRDAYFAAVEQFLEPITSLSD